MADRVDYLDHPVALVANAFGHRGACAVTLLCFHN